MSAVKNPRREWYTGEERVLVELWRAGERGEDIARAVCHSRAAVYSYVRKHHVRLGIKLRSAPPWTAAENRAVAYEIELALRRLGPLLPQRNRPAITQKMTEYLMGDAKRLKKRAFADKIEDLGGMSVGKTSIVFGESRSDHKPKKQAA